MRHIRNFLSNHTRPIILSLATLAFVALCFSSYYLTHASDAITLRINDGEIVVPGVDKFGTPKPFSLETKTTTANDYGYTLSAYSIADSRISITKDAGNNDCSTTVPLSTTKSTPTAIEVTTGKNTPSGSLNTVTTTYCAVVINGDIPDGEYNVTIAYHLAENDPPSRWVKSTTTLAGSTSSSIQVDLDSNMIPIVYKDDNGAYPSTWCNYNTQQWCNAATVNPSYLATAKSAPAGKNIPEEEILGYWVYIPRYEYQVCRPNASDLITLTAGQCQDGNNNDVLSTAAPYLFNINFQKSNQKTVFDGITVGNWSTHPAFTFGTTELNGIWVGKFETSHPTSSRLSSPTEQSYIKPNQLGISNQNVSTQFATAINMGTNGTGTTITTPANTQNLNNANVRQMKNSEWGAVAYLSTSIYGRGTNEMIVNACDNDVNNTQIGGDTYNDHTGWGGASTNCSILNASSLTSANVYNGTNGIHASTTDNVYGIYDMSGGSLEYVMGNRNNTAGSSGFSPLPDAKYYNNYPVPPFGTKPAWSTSNTEYYYSFDICTFATCGGQANYETTTVQSVSSATQSWGSDNSDFVGSSYPWFLRGGGAYAGSGAGLFNSGIYTGDAVSSSGFRAVLSAF
jgi:hypothetical protein